MSVLEQGGNAFDAAAATGFVLQVVEPHLNGPGGEVPAVFWSEAHGEPLALCGQGVSPAAATIERFHALGHELIPGTRRPRRVRARGLRRLAPPSARLRDVAARGRARIRHRLRGERIPAASADRRHDRAASGAALGVGGLRGALPAAARARTALPEPSARRDVSPDRRGEPRRFARGRDRAGAHRVLRGLRRGGDRPLLRERGRSPHRADIAAWRATIEPVPTLEYRGLTVCKTLPWGAGPVGAAAARAPRGLRPRRALGRRVRPRRDRCAKLALADRDALYGDADVPLDLLLSREYNDERRALVGDEAAGACDPGRGRLPKVRGPRRHRRLRRADARRHRPSRHRGPLREHGLGDAERRLAAQLTGDPGVRLAARDASPDVLARGGPALVAAAWSPPADDALPGPGASRRQAVPRLGDPGWRPAGAVGAPRVPAACRPRDGPAGGDRRARVPHRSSRLVLLPAGIEPRSLALESRFGARTVADLERRGHRITLWPDWSLGRVSAVAREPDGLLRAGANARGMQGYAAGR